MSAYTTRQELPGSLPAAASSALRLGALASDERFEVTVRVRPRAAPPDLAATDAALAPKPAQQQHLSREQYDAAFGADPADLAKVADFARHFGLVVLDSSTARRSVFLSGTAAQFAAAFGTQIEQVEHAGGIGRAVAAPLSVPTEVGDIVEGVFGLADTPVARPHLQQLPEAAAAAAGASFTPPQLAKLYNFPAGADGSGQCIAIIELGGGFRSADIKNYFKGLHLPVPTVKSISVDGGKNHPTTANSADGEVMLDIEVAAGVAPKALICVYFAPNTDKGFLDAITAAIHDKVNQPSVISISWGAAEKFWAPQALQSYDAAFQSAAALGVTVCCAAGDAGSGDENPDQGQPDGLAHVDFPAASPHVLACGGTRLSANGGGIASETVWNDDPLRSASGGGVSDFFDLPAYQGGAGVPQDLRKAFSWYQQAAFNPRPDGKKPQAQYQLAVMYDQGKGVPADPARALAFYKLAAVAGHPDAQNALATYFYEGQQVPRDPAIARKLFITAAAQGQSDAMFNAATMLFKGEGGAADPVQSYAWLQLASRLGNKQASPALAVVEGKLTPAQKEQARSILAP